MNVVRADALRSKLVVGMDISQLAHFGGVATYTENLTNELSKISDLEMVYFFSSLRKKAPLFIHGNVKKYRLPPTLFEMLFNRWWNIPIENFLGPLDIFHSSDWIQPPSKAKKVTTYHDVIPLKYPQWSHPRIIDVHKRRLRLVEEEIDFVIAVSQSTKQDLIEVSKIPEEKITVIYEGPTAKFKKRSVKEQEQFKKKYNLPDKFILSIGGIGEIRNLKRAKEATRGYNLVISGETIPWLDIPELELLYGCASVLLYPSYYSGFGIPILDAFLCELPVITSNISSMPEVGGEAALYVDPSDTEDIKEKLKMLMEDENLREEMIKKGLKQVKKFSWEKCAEETRDVYGRLML